MSTTTGTFRYVLNSKKGKFACPSCGKSKTYVRFWDVEAGIWLPEIYGKCDRVENCAYSMDPYSDGYAKQVREHEKNGNATPFPSVCRTIANLRQSSVPKTAYSIPEEYLILSTDPVRVKQTALFIGLKENRITNIPEEVIIDAFQRFKIGASGFRFKFKSHPEYKSEPGAVVFWNLDPENRIRGGQVVLFDKTKPMLPTVKVNGTDSTRHTRPVYQSIRTGLRRAGIAEPIWLTEYIEKADKFPHFFGLPQLKTEPIDKPIALTESYKAALIGSIYFPGFLWLGVGSMTYLTVERLRPLIGRQVILFPDKSKGGKTFQLWKDKACELGTALKIEFCMNAFLETRSDLNDVEMESGDIADYFLSRIDWTAWTSSMRKPKPETIARVVSKMKNDIVEPIKGETSKAFPLIKLKRDHQPWDDLDETIDYFKTAALPDSLRINGYSRIIETKKFVSSHIETIKFNNGNPLFVPYLDRLKEVQHILTEGIIIDEPWKYKTE
jgi:hypothetical protein